MREKERENLHTYENFNRKVDKDVRPDDLEKRKKIDDG